MAIKTLARFSPGRVIISALACTILVGALILALPVCRTQPISFLDLLFTTTSVTCVTGLETVPMSSFTTVGHTVILVLTQIGGLGLITLFIFLVSLFVNLGFTTQLMAVKILDLESWHNMRQLMKFIICFTLAVEFIGALSIFTAIHQGHTTSHALFLSCFHAVTCFCNAGITLFEGGMQSYNHNYLLLIISSLLIIAGGFGFLTWHEIFHHLDTRRKKKWHAFSLNAKLVFSGTMILIIVGTIVIYLLEYQHAYASMGFGQAITNALFQAVSARSAGLLSVNIQTFHLATLFFILSCAFIGTAPASTGSGVKITTFAVFLATIKAAIFGRTEVELKGRSIANDQLYKSIAIVSLSIFWIVASTFIMLIIEQDNGFADLFLEVASAFTTLGISTGITAGLCTSSKLLIMLTMIIGRIGSLTLVLALKELRSRKSQPAEFSYPEERVLLS